MVSTLAMETTLQREQTGLGEAGPLDGLLNLARGTFGRLFSRQTHPTIEEYLAIARPQDVVRITCIDYREDEGKGFHLTSAGAIPHKQLVEDLHLVLPGKQYLLLQAHSDCAKTKSMTERIPGELESAYQGRVDLRTLKRLFKDGKELVQDPAVREALRDGLVFCMAFHNVKTGETTYFENRSRTLVDEALGLVA